MSSLSSTQVRLRRYSRVPLLCLVLSLTSPAARADLVGQEAPDCPLVQLDGQGATSLKQQSAQGALYVDFWASWCSSCVHAFPFMNAIQERYGKHGLRVIAINLDEKSESAQKFLSRHPADFTIYATPGAACARDFGVEGMPASYLVDTAGVVRRVHLGFRQSDAAALVAAIEEVVAPPRPAP